MLNRRNYLVLAVVTVVLLGISAVIGSGHDLPLYLDDIFWFGFLACALLLVVSTVAILVRAVVGRGQHPA